MDTAQPAIATTTVTPANRGRAPILTGRQRQLIARYADKLPAVQRDAFVSRVMARLGSGAVNMLALEAALSAAFGHPIRPSTEETDS